MHCGAISCDCIIDLKMMNEISVRLREYQLPLLQHCLEHKKSRPCHGCWGDLRVQLPEPETLRQGHKAPPKESGTRDAERLGALEFRLLSAEGSVNIFKLKIFLVFYVSHLVPPPIVIFMECSYDEAEKVTVLQNLLKIWENNLLPLHHCPRQQSLPKTQSIPF